ncbi:MAG: HPr(Ser) kinase/phosphatase [Elusimicrobiales bacterium]|nr:HPr(Ser) kinase/phosphatase [Elusimicrobiales bacterium]
MAEKDGEKENTEKTVSVAEPEKNADAEKNIPVKSITVKDLMVKHGEALGLKRISGFRYMDRRITVKNLNRPGLAIAGHMELFRSERVQVIGQGEIAYCRKANRAKLLENFDNMFESGKVPCVIVSGGINPPRVIRKACQDNDVPLFVSSLETSKLIQELTSFLEEELSDNAVIHGVLVNVYGLGVLIQGEAGVGKSECALELVKRGHLLVADDVIKVRRRFGGWIMGEPDKQELSKNHMEVRGLGIINVKDLFGIGSIMDESYIEMRVFLEPVSPGTPWNTNRSGLNKETENILGVEIPSLRLPVTPGRNLAVLIEVAALNQRLTNKNGISTSEAIEKQLLEKLARKSVRNRKAKKTTGKPDVPAM